MPGYNYWVIVGPVAIALGLAIWLLLVARAASRRRTRDERPEQPDRGVVSGGRIEGSPGQMNRNDEAPRRG